MAEPPYKQSIEFRQNFFPFSGLSKSNFPISYILKGINYWIAEILYSTSFHDIDVTNVRKGNYQSCQSPMTFQSHCILHCEGSSGGGVTLQINPNGFSQVVGGPETPCSAFTPKSWCVCRGKQQFDFGHRVGTSWHKQASTSLQAMTSWQKLAGSSSSATLTWLWAAKCCRWLPATRSPRSQILKENWTIEN